MNRLADDSPERQIPWLPGERIELVLDSRTGAVTSPTIGEDLLTVTTHRAIRLGKAGGARITEIIPLDRVVHIEVDDVSRDSGRLVNGLIFLFVGAVAGWVIHALLAVTLITLLAGGIPAIVAVFLISGYLFPDEEGAFILYTAGSVLRHPLLTTESKQHAYHVAHRIYELMTGPVPVMGTSPQPENVDPVHPSNDGASTASVGDPSGTPAASELASVLRLAFEPTDETMTAEDAAEHITRSVSAITAATSYVTRQLVRDPEREQMGEGDYVWDLEFVAPDAYRVSQTGWSSMGEVRERWLTVGDDFYLDSQGWQRLLDSARFEEELALNKNLAVNKYITILKQGFPSLYDIVVAGGQRYLHLGYQPITRESLSAVLGNPSPMQGVGAVADLWIELDTHLLSKAEIAVIDARNGQRALFLQSFASYNAAIGVARPDAYRRESAPSAY